MEHPETALMITKQVHKYKYPEDDPHKKTCLYSSYRQSFQADTIPPRGVHGLARITGQF
jgi:hypothetical protein